MCIREATIDYHVKLCENDNASDEVSAIRRVRRSDNAVGYLTIWHIDCTRRYMQYNMFRVS